MHGLQAYRRADALEKRRKLMEAWARYCGAPQIEGGSSAHATGAVMPHELWSGLKFRAVSLVVLFFSLPKHGSY
jgi:hypothetical protein